MAKSKEIFMESREYVEPENLETAFTLPEGQLEGIEELQVGDIYPSKSSALALAQRMAGILEEGKASAVETAIRLCAMKEMAEKAAELIRPYVLDELDKEKGKASRWECKIEKAEVGSKYDYSLTPEWVELKKQEDDIAAKRKAIEERLKKIPTGKLLVDEETGETLCGPAKTSTSSFKVTLKK